MSTKYRFPTGVLAGAFIGAVSAAFGQWDEDGNYTTDVESPENLGDGEVALDCCMDDDVFCIACGNTTGATLVNTLERLEAAIAETIKEFGGDSLVLDPSDSGIGYDATLHRDGSVNIGCQEHSEGGADQIIAAARRVAKGGGFKEFTTTDGFIVRCPTKGEISDGEFAKGDILIHHEQARASDIVDLAEQRADFLKKKTVPFRLFAKK